MTTPIARPTIRPTSIPAVAVSRRGSGSEVTSHGSSFIHLGGSFCRGCRSWASGCGVGNCGTGFPCVESMLSPSQVVRVHLPAGSGDIADAPGGATLGRRFFHPPSSFITSFHGRKKIRAFRRANTSPGGRENPSQGRSVGTPEGPDSRVQRVLRAQTNPQGRNRGRSPTIANYLAAAASGRTRCYGKRPLLGNGANKRIMQMRSSATSFVIVRLPILQVNHFRFFFAARKFRDRMPLSKSFPLAPSSRPPRAAPCSTTPAPSPAPT